MTWCISEKPKLSFLDNALSNCTKWSCLHGPARLSCVPVGVSLIITLNAESNLLETRLETYKCIREMSYIHKMQILYH